MAPFPEVVLRVRFGWQQFIKNVVRTVWFGCIVDKTHEFCFQAFYHTFPFILIVIVFDANRTYTYDRV